MKKVIILFLLISSAFKLSSQCVYDWGAGAFMRAERAMTRDHSGHIITVSASGGSDVIKKYSSTGALLFNKNFYAENFQLTWDCYADVNDNIYITGTHKGTLHFGATTLFCAYDVCAQVFIIKLDSNGNLLWIKNSSGNYGSSADGDEGGYEVSADSAGNCYISGFYDANFIFGPYDLSGTGSNNFIAKLNGATGSVMWIKAFNSYFNVLYCPKTEARKNGDFFQAANFKVNVGVDSTTILSPNRLYEENIYITMYDKNGNLKWYLNSTGEGFINSTTMDSHENFIITGTMTDSLSFGSYKIYSMLEKGIFCVKVDTLGNILKLERIASCASISADLRVSRYGVDVDSADNLYLSGRMDQDVNFNGLASSDVLTTGTHSYVAKYDNTLTPVWFNTYEASLNSYGYNTGVAKLENKNVYVTGNFYNDIIIDSISFNFGTNQFYEYFAEVCDQNGSFEYSATAIAENEVDKIIVFPNPASSYLNLQNLPEDKFKNLEIYNSSGVITYSSSEYIDKIELDSKKFSNGLYLLKIRYATGEEKITRFIINH